MRHFYWITAFQITVLGVLLLLAHSAAAQNSVSGRAVAISILDSNRDQDGLLGSVRRVQTESAKFELKGGQLKEGPLQLLEVTTYDLKGARTDNASYPVPSSPVGKEEYKYDQRGNIIEMTLRGEDGSIVSRETYKYEFDRVGNWTKMVTSLVLFEAGELKYEPVEATYRRITYYFDQTISKILDTQPHAASVIPSAPPSVKARLPEQPTPTFTRADLTTTSVETVAAPPPALKELQEVGLPSGSSNQIASEPDRVSPEIPSRVGLSPSEKNLTATSSSLTDIAPKPAVPNESTTHKLAYGLYKSGRERFDQGNLVGAVEAYQQSLQLEPDVAEVHLSLGYAYLKLKKSADAIKAFKESIRLNPDKEEAHYGLGVEYFRINKIREAAEAFKKAVKLKPKMGKAHYGLALAYQEMQRRDLLVEQYRILETLDPVLAKKLESTYPQLAWPCRAPPFCR